MYSYNEWYTATERDIERRCAVPKPRDSMVAVRFTARERSLVDAAAERADVSRSQLIRSAVTDHAITILRSPAVTVNRSTAIDALLEEVCDA
jgi:uncharacterized protein (DUF1778 family)